MEYRRTFMPCVPMFVLAGIHVAAMVAYSGGHTRVLELVGDGYGCMARWLDGRG